MDRFLFVGDDLALDFINTRVRVRGRERELIETAVDLEQWWAEASRRYPGLEPLAIPVSGTDLERLRAFRNMLREHVSSAVDRGRFDPSLSAQVNDVLSHAHPYVTADESATRLDVRANDPRERILVAIAVAAANLVTQADAERLHRCGGCILHFYDRTKSGTRRWCSTRCFDRARAQQRRATAG